MTVEALIERVEYWQGILGLTHWTIKVELVEECDAGPHNSAAVRPSVYYTTADLQVTESAMEKDEYERDAIIVHELIHILFRDLTEASHVPLKFLNRDVAELYSDRLDFETEGVVDVLARSIAALSTQAW